MDDPLTFGSLLLRAAMNLGCLGLLALLIAIASLVTSITLFVRRSRRALCAVVCLFPVAALAIACVGALLGHLAAEEAIRRLGANVTPKDYAAGRMATLSAPYLVASIALPALVVALAAAVRGRSGRAPEEAS